MRRPRQTILLVEDDHSVRALVRKVLTARGYSVLEAASGVEAMAACEQHAGVIHLLLSDLVMPDLTGPDLAQRILTKRSRIAVLFMSGHAARINSYASAVGLAAGLLEKPFTTNTLLERVRSSLGHQPGTAAS